MTTTRTRDWAVVADDGACVTYCTSLAGAKRSAKGFNPAFQSLVIKHKGEIVQVIR
jgi:hypothetical protein